MRRRKAELHSASGTTARVRSVLSQSLEVMCCARAGGLGILLCSVFAPALSTGISPGAMHKSVHPFVRAFSSPANDPQTIRKRSYNDPPPAPRRRIARGSLVRPSLRRFSTREARRRRRPPRQQEQRPHARRHDPGRHAAPDPPGAAGRDLWSHGRGWIALRRRRFLCPRLVEPEGGRQG